MSEVIGPVEEKTIGWLWDGYLLSPATSRF
jgi:hypothetical protein